MPDVFGLTDEELAGYRAVQAAHLAVSGLVPLRRARQGDGAGGSAYVWAEDPDLSIKARLGLPSAAEVSLAHDRFGIEARWAVTVPYGTGLKLGDRLTFGDLTVQLAGHLSAWSWETAERHAAIQADPQVQP